VKPQTFGTLSLRKGFGFFMQRRSRRFFRPNAGARHCPFQSAAIFRLLILIFPINAAYGEKNPRPADQEEFLDEKQRVLAKKQRVPDEKEKDLDACGRPPDSFRKLLKEREWSRAIFIGP
jgi:hypothetical protein